MANIHYFLTKTNFYNKKNYSNYFLQKKLLNYKWLSSLTIFLCLFIPQSSPNRMDLPHHHTV